MRYWRLSILAQPQASNISTRRLEGLLCRPAFHLALDLGALTCHDGQGESCLVEIRCHRTENNILVPEPALEVAHRRIRLILP